MAKQTSKKAKSLSDAEEGLASRPDTPDEILAKVAKFESEHKSAIGDENSPTVADAIYFYDLRYKDSDRVYINHRFHGKCAKKGLEHLHSIGYQSIVTRSLLPADYEHSRTTCEGCNEQLNAKLAKKLAKELKEKRAARADIQKEKRLAQLEYEKEQVLLGRL